MMTDATTMEDEARLRLKASSGYLIEFFDKDGKKFISDVLYDGKGMITIGVANLITEVARPQKKRVWQLDHVVISHA